MAWTTPPTFVNGAVLSAAQMNILSDDIEYLRGFVSGANPGVPEVTITDNGDIYFLIRHLFQYLHLRVTATPDGGSGADVHVYYDAVDVYHDGSPDGLKVYAIDVSGFGLTVGQVYVLKVHLEGHDNRTVHYAIESDAAVL